ncbi:MAG: hypothetical protein MJZ22_04195 [Candidatus Saccharibacteria bacterium]|nr:hypothetical protein [Candidatus Saccharibacteria bacterium]
MLAFSVPRGTVASRHPRVSFSDMSEHLNDAWFGIDLTLDVKFINMVPSVILRF